jgi:hypothetical protein
MTEFNDVTAVKKANIYFGGKVVSRTVLFHNGVKKTLGYMQAGEYEFNTGAPEVMEVLGGSCEVQLADAASWKPYAEGQSFKVPGHSKFKIKVAQGLDYCCSFGE